MCSSDLFPSHDTSASPNYSGTVFEPIDEFKGDVARMILYFATRYESKLSSFKDNDILTNSAFPGVEAWELAVLKEWHTNDPVSQREIDRNNAAYTYQGNRNPFIDQPEYVALIWGTTTPDTEAPSTPTNLIVTGSTSSTISLSWTASTDNIMVATYDIYLDGTLKTSSATNSATVTGLNPSTTYTFYIKAKDAAGNTSNQSNTATGTTKENTGGNDGGSTTSCGTEDFEGVSGAVNTYKTVTWNNNGITWTATDSRSDQTLKTKLSSIISSGHQTKSYDALDDEYPNSDKDSYYEKDGTVLDIYSENPTETDPYVYQFGVKKCGNYKIEGDCYNKEHIFPQGYFNKASPMVSDIHHIVPTDGKVNGMRSNFPFGNVGSYVSYTSKNGS